MEKSHLHWTSFLGGRSRMITIESSEAIFHTYCAL
jgi:hypothetical protein